MTSQHDKQGPRPQQVPASKQQLGAPPAKTAPQVASTPGEIPDSLVGCLNTSEHSSGQTVDPMVIAGRGMTGPAESLPYRGSLEQSFGRDLGQIKAYRDDNAQKSAGALNADAFSHQGNVVLSPSADYRTVAEETSHALQQTSGEGGFSGLTRPGDGAELEATRAADAAVCGAHVGPLSSSLAPQSVARSIGRQNQQNPQTSLTETSLRGSATVDPKHVDAVKDSMHLKVGDLDDQQMLSHLMTQYGIWQQKIGGKGENEKLNFVKFIEPPVVARYLGGVYGPTVGGSIGYAETTQKKDDGGNTVPMSPDETVKTLGLDYKGSKFTQGRDNKTSIPKVHYIKFQLTKEKAEANMGISMAEPMKKKAEELATSATDPKVKEMASKIKIEVFKWYEENERNPYRGTGITGTGSSMEGMDSINQELNAKGRITIDPGSEMYCRDDQGDHLMATLQGDGSWQISSTMAPADAAGLKRSASAAKGAATRKANKAATT